MRPYAGEGFYQRIGVKPAINPRSWVTVLGGGIIPPPVVKAMEEAQSLVRELLEVPEGYSILFIQGGASLEFIMAPYNLMKVVFPFNTHVNIE